MATYEVELEDGSKYQVETEDSSPSSPQASMPIKERGILGKGWDALAIPERMSREGLKMIADASKNDQGFTGNLPRDIASHTGEVAMDTLAETAPSFVNRASIVTAGLLKGAKVAAPLVKGLGKGLAKTAESLSGLEHKTPGVLTEAANDPSLIFGQGTKKAGKLFEDLQDKGRIRQAFARATDNKSLVDDALKAVDDGSLTPEEALIARRSLDKIKRNIPGFAYKSMRQAFDGVAKTKSKQADAAFSRAVKSEALRQAFGINKHGGTSAFKLGGGAVTGTLPLMSPALQGMVATLLGVGAKGVGALARTPIQSGSAVGSLLDLLNKDQRHENR